MSDPWIVEGKAPKIKPISIFGHFLKMRRASLGIKQRTLAEAFGHTYSFTEVERGLRTMPASKLKTVAEILEVELGMLEKVYALDLFMRNRRAEQDQMR